MKNTNDFILSEKGNIKYNAVLINPEKIKKEGGAVLYSIYEINGDSFHAENRNAWGMTLYCSGVLTDVEPYNKK